MKNNKFVYGMVMGILGIMLFSSKAILVKFAYRFGIDSVSLLLFRMLFSLPIYLVILFFHRNKEQVIFTPKLISALFFLGFVGYYLASYFDFEGLKYIDASMERLILFSYPTFVVIFASIWHKKPIEKLQKIAIIFTYIGILIMFIPNLLTNHEQKISMLGAFFVLLSAITYASYLVGSGVMMLKMNATKFTTYVMIVSCLCVIAHYLFILPVYKIFTYPPQIYYLGMIMAVFATVIPSFLLSECIVRIGADKYAVIASLSPVFTIIFSVILLDEILSIYQIIGAVIIVITVVYMNYRNAKDQKKTQ